MFQTTVAAASITIGGHSLTVACLSSILTYQTQAGGQTRINAIYNLEKQLTYFLFHTLLISKNKELIPCSCGGQSKTLPLPYSFKIQAKKPIVDVAQPCNPPLPPFTSL